ncbi:MAG: hypothetical protein IPP35_04020 [Elusimicrobia bacterium]|nr:hypothetical protein [Elusimicrobiota bacterium]
MGKRTFPPFPIELFRQRTTRALARVLFFVRPLHHFLIIKVPRAGVWVFRPALAGAFLLTTLFGPASAWAQSRASQMLGQKQYDEFSTSSEDGAYFSPERLRARIEAVDALVAGQNARFARLQGRAVGGVADLGPRVFQMALEKFQTAASMNADVEMKRARFSARMAAAGGFQYRTFADGKRMWFKNGRVHRIENEKIKDSYGGVHVQDTTEMEYDKHGNLLKSKTETRDAAGHADIKRWSGTYAVVPGRDRLESFTETSWDALGNESRLERTNLTWSGDGKNLVGYEEKSTDANGRETTRRVWDSTHDEAGNLTSFKEESTEGGVKQFRTWSGATYENFKKDKKDDWRLTGYKETTRDAAGRESTREWGGTKYDERGALVGYREKRTDPAGETTDRSWGDAAFDDQGT